jgi:murein DD-endopeptidase MepM/ murein hydrolase activator NlpD
MLVRSRYIVGIVVVIAGALAAGGSAGAAPCWLPPVAGTVTDPFREPSCRWCAGNRGLDYRLGDGQIVRAAASGRVEFVGVVVDVRYVVVRLPNGWRHTYGQLTSSQPQNGDVVLAGAPIGRASGTFFFGLRIGDDYADPAPFIGELRGRPRLVPFDGPARPAPPARPRCPSSDERTALPRAPGSSPRSAARWR